MFNQFKMHDIKMQAMDPETGNIYDFGEIQELKLDSENVSTDEVVKEDLEKIRTLWQTDEITMTAKIISHFAVRLMTGTASNNELKIHHKPMRRRKRR